ncbi:peptide ABC transporter [Haematobacter massiliensis]|uniref:Peptide ABC transporter n=1 Tax=Haematobacter massiliensis TaxID=195105 RepID=A0A086Y222_9RHOB|nr:ABC transporter substrate-binding protein [Haematobacter massiliensis]KFI28322.1 peptide ABC transporter [Haematobacter massiliensis]
MTTEIGRTSATQPDWRRRLFILGTAGAGALAMSGLPGRVLAATTERLKVALHANPSSLDPATGSSGSDHMYLYCLYDTLTEWDPDTLTVRPGLARSHAFTDPKTLVLDLEEGVTFHDGTPLDAEAVKFNLDRVRSEPISNIRADLATVESVEVTGPLQVTLHLKESDSALPLILSDRVGMVLSPTALRASEGGRIDRAPVGSGPWKLVSWTDGERFLAERHPGYWRDDRPGMQEIEILIMPDAATRLRSLQSGQTHIACQITELLQPIVKRSPTLEVRARPTIWCYTLFLNASKGPLADVRVRQALNHAIDRENFIRAAMAGQGEAASMMLPKSHWAYATEAEGRTTFDLDKAKALLAEAGYADGFTLDFRGFPDQAYVQRQEVILNQLSKVGIRGRFANAPIPETDSRWWGERQGEAYFSVWTGRPDPTNIYTILYGETSYYNPSRLKPPEGFMEAIAESRATDDQAARAKALSKAQVLAMDFALNVPIAFRYQMDAVNRSVSDFGPNLLGKPKFTTAVVGS